MVLLNIILVQIAKAYENVPKKKNSQKLFNQIGSLFL